MGFAWGQRAAGRGADATGLAFDMKHSIQQ